MCLIKTHDEPKIAQTDIEVWKVLTSEGLSPYLDYPYHHGMNKPLEQKEIRIDQMLIEDGYLYAYRNKETAELNAAMLNRIFGSFTNLEPIEHVVHRMIIPKGTAYYEGDDSDICAECLYWPEEETAAPKKD